MPQIETKSIVRLLFSALVALALVGSIENTHGNDKNAALWKACKDGDPEKVATLLKDGADVKAKDGTGNTAWLRATSTWSLDATSIRKRLKVVEILLDHGADINEKETSRFGTTALVRTAFIGATPLVRLLLQRGADTDIRTNMGATALMAACASREFPQTILERVKLILDKGAKVDLKNHKGMTALMMASRSGRPEVVKELLAKGAKVDLKDKSGRTALDFANKSGDKKVVELLRSHEGGN